jgi:hypothetical protein
VYQAKPPKRQKALWASDFLAWFILLSITPQLTLFSGRFRPDSHLLEMSPYLEAGDIDEALQYAAWRVEEIEVKLAM